MFRFFNFPLFSGCTCMCILNPEIFVMQNICVLGKNSTKMSHEKSFCDSENCLFKHVQKMSFL
jgi:hypothetical protein